MHTHTHTHTHTRACAHTCTFPQFTTYNSRKAPNNVNAQVNSFWLGICLTSEEDGNVRNVRKMKALTVKMDRVTLGSTDRQ